jgi:hypothetical protein
MNELLQRGWRPLLTFACALVSALACISLSAELQAPVHAHGGGTPRLTSVPAGPYRIYAWSDPEPWRVGQVHLSLAVTTLNPESNSNQIEIPVTDVEITVTYTPMKENVVDPSAEPVVVKAVRQEFLSDFYYEADPTLTRAGDWQISVEVQGEAGSGSTEFAMVTLPEQPINWMLIGGGAGLLVVIVGLIAVWSRSQKPVQPVHRPHRGVRRVARRSSKVHAPKEHLRKEV